jgi:hypothetical protein
MTNTMNRRRVLLLATLGFLQLPHGASELRLLHSLSDSWRGIGLIADGLQRHGFALEFRQYPMGWRVNIRRVGADAIVGSGWDPMPWRSMQQAGWDALKHHETAF